MCTGFMYCVAAIDWFSRYVLAWGISTVRLFCIQRALLTAFVKEFVTILSRVFLIIATFFIGFTRGKSYLHTT